MGDAEQELQGKEPKTEAEPTEVDDFDDDAAGEVKPAWAIQSTTEKIPVKKRTRHMKRFPELYADDVSINPSYTGLRNFPFNVVCRQRFHKNKMKMIRQMNREIMHMAMMQTFAIDSVRVDRVFSVGFPPEAVIVPDFATSSERRRINMLLEDR